MKLIEERAMIADTDLQVWLDAQPNAGQTVMIPYVKSAKDLQMSFRMDVIQHSGAGTSRISQQGRVNAPAEQPTALGRVALGAQTDGECRVELTLNDGAKELGAYHFDCPR
jgi:hypothetical protein